MVAVADILSLGAALRSEDRSRDAAVILQGLKIASEDEIRLIASENIVGRAVCAGRKAQD